MKIVLQGKSKGLTYREAMHRGNVVAAIWRIPRDGNACYSVVTPTKSEPRTFATLSAAKRWVSRLVKPTHGIE